MKSTVYFLVRVVKPDGSLPFVHISDFHISKPFNMFQLRPDCFNP